LNEKKIKKEEDWSLYNEIENKKKNKAFFTVICDL
jgi:hypothetical protein